MPLFAYKAKGADGNAVAGTLEAEDQKAAIEQVNN